MTPGRLATQLGYSFVGILAVMSARTSLASPQDDHTHGTAAHQQAPSPVQKNAVGALVKIVRESTARFRDVSVAEAEGYALQFGCVSGSDAGAMGLHYVNASLVSAGVLDATRPQIVIYEPAPNGTLRLVGADYLLIAKQWDAAHPDTPQLMGQLFHLFESPNRFGLPAFYTLHVWAWKDNPTGMFVNWHSNVSCEAFAGKP